MMTADIIATSATLSSIVSFLFVAKVVGTNIENGPANLEMSSVIHLYCVATAISVFPATIWQLPGSDILLPEISASWIISILLTLTSWLPLYAIQIFTDQDYRELHLPDWIVLQVSVAGVLYFISELFGFSHLSEAIFSISVSMSSPLLHILLLRLISLSVGQMKRLNSSSAMTFGYTAGTTATVFVFLLCIAPVADVTTLSCVILSFLGLLLSFGSRSQFFNKAGISLVPLVSLFLDLNVVWLACTFAFAYAITLYEPDWVNTLFNPTLDESLCLQPPDVIITAASDSSLGTHDGFPRAVGGT